MNGSTIHQYFTIMFAIMYEDLYYTTVPPIWGPTFTPNKNDAHLFHSEEQARKEADNMATFSLNIVQL